VTVRIRISTGGSPHARQLTAPPKSAPHNMSRIGQAAVVLTAGLLLVAVLAAAFVLGSLIAVGILLAFLFSLIALVVRILVGKRRGSLRLPRE